MQNDSGLHLGPYSVRRSLHRLRYDTLDISAPAKSCVHVPVADSRRYVYSKTLLLNSNRHTRRFCVVTHEYDTAEKGVSLECIHWTSSTSDYLRDCHYLLHGMKASMISAYAVTWLLRVSSRWRSVRIHAWWFFTPFSYCLHECLSNPRGKAAPVTHNIHV